MTDPQKVDELRESAQLLAKQALETAELGIRLVRTQFENVAGNAPSGAADVQRTLQNTTLNVETKAKEMFTLATHFMQELNDKWQPTTAQPGSTATEEKPRPEKINIDVD